MKNLTTIIIIISTFIFGSCSDFLKEEPYSLVDPGTLFETPEGALGAINATYKIMVRNQNSFGRDFLHVTEQPTEMITTRRDDSDDRGRMDTWKWDETTGFLAQAWTEAYAVINAANGVIENVPNIEMDEELKNRIVGEAKFLRAYNYFILVQLWGDVPIRLEQIKGISGSLDLFRSPAIDVYNNVIIPDLIDAEKVLFTEDEYDNYPGSNTGRASRGAARALLAKVYLQKGTNPVVSENGDFAESIKWSELVINEENYELEDDYRAIFDINSENGKEIIFDLQQTSIAGLGGDLSGHVVPRNSGLGRRSWGNFHAEVPFFNTYIQNDQRKGSFILEYEDDGEQIIYNPDNFADDGYVTDGPGFFKLAEIDPSIGAESQERPNKVLLRYADVLLMHAEAINELNNGPNDAAYLSINEVRSRAGVPNLTEGLNYDQFLDSLFSELRKEFIFEYHGWFDGIRHWDLFTDRVLNNVQVREQKIQDGEWPSGNNAAPKQFTTENIKSDKYKLFPIPFDIMINNKELEQQPEWR